MRTEFGLVRLWHKKARNRLFPHVFISSGPGPILSPIELHADDAAREAISGIGRTEDVRFSPEGKTLVLAGFSQQRCLLLSVSVCESDSAPAASVEDFMVVTSPGIGQVHGVDFLDERTLVVANRDGGVSVVELPGGPFAGRDVSIEPLAQLRGSGAARIESPGSVVVTRTGSGAAEILVCNNYTDRVTRHEIERRGGTVETLSELVYMRGLDIPDGISVTSDGRWVAVSSHGTHDVKVYSATRTGRCVRSIGKLKGSSFPHGLRFTPDGEHLLLADAGSPFLFVYDRGRGWDEAKAPRHSVALLDEAAFLRGRSNPQEGGPKGIDIDPTGRVVAMTTEQIPLAFYLLRSVLEGRPRV